MKKIWSYIHKQACLYVMNKYWLLNRLMLMTKNLWFKRPEIYLKRNQAMTTINSSLEQELFALERREKEDEMPDTGHIF